MDFVKEIVWKILRDHEGYTGDDKDGRGELPWGDTSTRHKPILKRDLREVLEKFVEWIESGNATNQAEFEQIKQDAQAAEQAAELALQAMVDVQGAAFFAANLNTLLANDEPEYPVGTIFMTRAEGYSYEVVDSDSDRTTAGGVGLQARPANGILDFVQFGADPTGVEVADDLMNRAFDRAKQFNAKIVQNWGTFLWSGDPVEVQADADLSGSEIKLSADSGIKPNTWAHEYIFNIVPSHDLIELSAEELADLNDNYRPNMISGLSILQHPTIRQYRDAHIQFFTETIDIRA